MTTSNKYGEMFQAALVGVVRQVLDHIVQNDMPEEHHLYISFESNAPGVIIPPYLKERYPNDMTIVLQHQFWDLNIRDSGFDVGLSFSGKPEQLTIPFAAVLSFLDPSVPFGLQLRAAPEAPTEDGISSSASDVVATEVDEGGPDEDGGDKPAAGPDEQENVISLDVFRKK